MDEANENTNAHNLNVKRLEELDQRLITQIMSTPQGREWMWNLLALCKIGHTAMRQTDRETAFTLGEQNIGLQLQNKIFIHAPDMWIKTLEERQGQ
jgi:predicted restriction endonuclease